MSRDVLYRSQSSPYAGKYPSPRMIRVEMAPAYNDLYDTTITIVDVPWRAFGDKLAGISSRAGWEDLVIGLPTAETVKLTFDLNELGGSSAMEDFREYLLYPSFTAGGTLTIDGVGRDYDTLNTFTIYTDDGTGGTTWRILFQGCQRRQPSRSGEFTMHRVSAYTVELVHVSHILATIITPDDIGRWMMFDDGTAGEKGPHQWCYSLLYKPTGAPAYAYAHGSYNVAGVHPEFTFYKLNRFAYGVSSLGEQVYQALTRRSTSEVRVYSATETGGTLGSWLDHWTLYEPKFDEATFYLHSATTIPTTTRYVLGKVAFSDEPDTVVGGLFGPDGLQGKWKTLHDMLKGSLESAVAKGRFSVTPGAGVFRLRLDMAALSAGFASALEIVAADMGATARFETGALLVSGANASVTGGTEGDMTEIPVTSEWSTGNESGWQVPAGLHTMPQLWPDGDRSYIAAGFDVIADANSQLVVYSRFVPIWCIWFPSTAGGILSAERMVKAHHFASVTDGVQTRSTAALAMTLPTPDRALFISETGGTNDPDNKPYGDTVFGSPLRLQMLAVQDVGCNTAWLAGYVISERHSQEMQTTYTGEIMLDHAEGQEVGEMTDAGGFPDGSAFLDGESYLGDLPGGPILARVESEYIEGIATVKLLGVP